MGQTKLNGRHLDSMNADIRKLIPEFAKSKSGFNFSVLLLN